MPITAMPPATAMPTIEPVPIAGELLSSSLEEPFVGALVGELEGELVLNTVTTTTTPEASVDSDVRTGSSEGDGLGGAVGAAVGAVGDEEEELEDEDSDDEDEDSEVLDEEEEVVELEELDLLSSEVEDEELELDELALVGVGDTVGTATPPGGTAWRFKLEAATDWPTAMTRKHERRRERDAFMYRVSERGEKDCRA